MADPNLDSQLASLAKSAIATLATEMINANQSKDRQAAANSILDRVGFGRATRVQADVAEEEIRNALEAAAGPANEAMRKNDPLVIEAREKDQEADK